MFKKAIEYIMKNRKTCRKKMTDLEKDQTVLSKTYSH